MIQYQTYMHDGPNCFHITKPTSGDYMQCNVESDPASIYGNKHVENVCLFASGTHNNMKTLGTLPPLQTFDLAFGPFSDS